MSTLDNHVEILERMKIFNSSLTLKLMFQSRYVLITWWLSKSYAATFLSSVLKSISCFNHGSCRNFSTWSGCVSIKPLPTARFRYQLRSTYRFIVTWDGKNLEFCEPSLILKTQTFLVILVNLLSLLHVNFQNTIFKSIIKHRKIINIFINSFETSARPAVLVIKIEECNEFIKR